MKLNKWTSVTQIFYPTRLYFSSSSNPFPCFSTYFTISCYIIHWLFSSPFSLLMFFISSPLLATLFIFRSPPSLFHLPFSSFFPSFNSLHFPSYSSLLLWYFSFSFSLLLPHLPFLILTPYFSFSSLLSYLYFSRHIIDVHREGGGEHLRKISEDVPFSTDKLRRYVCHIITSNLSSYLMNSDSSDSVSFDCLVENNWYFSDSSGKRITRILIISIVNIKR